MIRLRDLRNEKGISQRKMGEIFNVSQATYNNWEKGNTQPSIEQLIELARFFGVSVDFLIGNTDDEGYVKIQEVLSQNDIATLHTFNTLQFESKKLLLEFISSLKK
ncbi:MAG: helix-turn-helix domain-containing protein [Christensenellales bacterium]